MAHPFYQETRGEFKISTKPDELDLTGLVRLIQTTRWAKHRPEDVIRRSVENSLTFQILHGAEVVGGARIVTDWATFAYLCDVVVAEEYRGQGLSKWLMEVVLKHPGLESIRRWSLLTLDAHGLYRKFGFENHPDPKRYMEKFNPVDHK